MDTHDDMGGHHHAPGSHISFECDGTHFTGMGYQRPSNWSAHFVPGIMLSLWAAHWTIAIFRTWFGSSSKQPYRAQGSYALIPRLPVTWAVEPVVKVVFSFVGIMCQLWWSHGHWSRSICPEGTLRAGHFSITAVHNWQNAWTLMAYMLSGLVDIAARFVALPENLPHLTTTAAFALQSFAYYQGQHQDMLDAMVYYIAFMTTAATAVAMVFELWDPHAFWLGCVKAYTLWLQAAWCFAMARFLFEGRTAWDTLQPVVDMSPEMFAPVMVVMWMNIISLAMLFVFIIMRWWYAAHLNEHLKGQAAVERTLVLPGKGAAGGSTRNSTHELMPLMSRLP